MKQIRKAVALVCCILLLFPSSVMADAAIDGGHNYQPADFYVVVDAWDGYVNFRYGPGLEYGINFPINNGEVLYVFETAENYYDELWWGHVEYGGYYGWISLTEVSFMEAPEPESPVYEYVDQYNMVDAWDGYCNLRMDAGIAYDIITPIYNGEILHVTIRCYNPEDGLNWGYTEYNGMTGWISLSQTTQVPAPQPETTTAQPEPPAPGPAVSDAAWLVSDAFYQEDSNNIFSIPVVNLESDEIKALNAAIYEELYPQIQEALKDDTSWANLFSSVYTWGVNGDILSLVIRISYIGPWHEYRVYNISVSQQKLLNDTAVIGMAGYSEQEYLEMAASAMEQSFVRYTQMGMHEENEIYKNAYNNAHEETLLPENIEAAMPFLNAKGDLCIIAEIRLVMMQNTSAWTELDLVNPYSEDPDKDIYVRVNGPEGYGSLKTEPGPSGNVIASIPNGQRILIFDRMDNAGDGQIWEETAYNGQKGWILMSEASE